MKKAADHHEDDMRAEYDFSSATKKPYAARFALGSNIVMIKPEIFAAFPSEKAVNDALESLMHSEKKTGARATRRRPVTRTAQGAISR